jgi:hypothetical protein
LLRGKVFPVGGAVRGPWWFVIGASVVVHAILATVVRADDGAIEAVGGAVRAMRDHPTIEMVAEYVHVRLAPGSADVECVFVLLNRGPATTVTVGFPCASGGADVTKPVPFKEFHSYVDGRPVDVRVLHDSTNQMHSEFGSWWVKDVSFAANEMKSIRNTYVAEPGISVPDYHWFEYILETGGSWAGTIRSADIVVTLNGITDLQAVRPTPTSRTNSELRWHFQNLEPNEESGADRIEIWWRE